MSETRTHIQKNHRSLIGTGVVFVSLGVALACRIIWEETFLTWQQGPQMVGFSLAHGYYAPLLMAPILVIVWLLIALIVSIVDRVKHFQANKLLLALIGASALTLGSLCLPEVFWQWLFIGSFAKSSHASELMTYDAAMGATATVRAYLDHGVSLESKNYEGSTAAFTASAGGSVDVLRLLAERGADLNALNSYGDSPLEAAVENHRNAAAQYLRDRGAKQIAGTPEQRDAASKAIVDREIQQEKTDK